MPDRTAIEWTDATWNPLIGCAKISPGCKHCYAEVFAERFRGVRGHRYEHGFDLRLTPETLDLPLRWTRPRLVFVNSMSDLFQAGVPDEYIDRVYDVMERATQHTFQVLTKRPDRMAAHLEQRARPPLANVWHGMSIESEPTAQARTAFLSRIRRWSTITFVSAEPLLGHIPTLGFSLGVVYDGERWKRRLHSDVDWLIVGGESGLGARPMHPRWARRLRDQAEAAGVAFHFKQWGQYRPIGPLYDHEGAVPDRVLHEAAELGNRVVVVDTNGTIWNEREAQPPGKANPYYMARVTRKADAGRLLDRREWNGMPTRSA